MSALSEKDIRDLDAGDEVWLQKHDTIVSFRKVGDNRYRMEADGRVSYGTKQEIQSLRD